MFTAESNEHGLVIIIVSVALFLLCTIAVVSRAWSRLISETGLWWDDWLAFVGWLPVAGLTTTTIIWVVAYNLGVTSTPLSPSDLIQGGKMMYIVFWIFTFGLAFPKISMLFFYWRVFGPDLPRWFKWSTGLAALLTLVRFLCGFITNLVQCRPIRKNWDVDVPGYCFGGGTRNVYNTVLDFLPDLIILVMPIPLIWKIHTTRSRKISISAFFIVGYTTVVITIVEIIIGTLRRGSVNDSPASQWTTELYCITSETHVSLFAVCLPSTWSLVTRAKKHGLRSLLRKKAYIRGQEIKRVLAEQRAASPSHSGRGDIVPLQPINSGHAKILESTDVESTTSVHSAFKSDSGIAK